MRTYVCAGTYRGERVWGIPWSWSYRWGSLPVRVLGTELQSSVKSTKYLTVKPSLQALPKKVLIIV